MQLKLREVLKEELTKSKKKPITLVRGKDTRDIWKCPVCGRKYRLIHIEYEPPCRRCKQHDFEEVIE